MGLEDAGCLYLSKSGKGIIIKIDNEKISKFKIYLTAYTKAVQELLEEKRAEVPIKLLVNDKSG